MAAVAINFPEPPGHWCEEAYSRPLLACVDTLLYALPRVALPPYSTAALRLTSSAVFVRHGEKTSKVNIWIPAMNS